MSDRIQEIALRLKGLRDALDLSTKEMAERGSISEEQYNIYESGDIDIPVSVMHQICQRCNVDISELLTGESPHNLVYAVTYSGKAITVKRNTEYNYQALAYNFKGRKAEPYLVEIAPYSSPSMPTNVHEGQEFNYILEGKVEVMLENKKIVLEAGDSIYFNASAPHGLRALGNTNAKLLAILMS